MGSQIKKMAIRPNPSTNQCMNARRNGKERRFDTNELASTDSI
jgi:hypothetical protein